MESRKRKEVPGSADEDVSEIPDRPTISRELDVKEGEIDNAQVSNVSVAGCEIEKTEASTETNDDTVAVNDIDAAAVTNAIVAAALPSDPASASNSNEPAIDNGCPHTLPTDLRTEEKSELDAANGLIVIPKVLSKPSSPEELAHWNQMFFDLMVRVFTTLFCFALFSFVQLCTLLICPRLCCI